MGTSTTALAAAQLERAKVLLELGRAKEALPFIGEAIRLDPDRIDSHCYHALALRSIGELQQSLAVLDATIRREPNHEWPHRLRSIVLAATGNKSAALTSAREAHRLAPDVWQTAYTLAEAYLDLGNLTKAREMAERLLALVPESAHGFELLGRIALQANKLLAAEAHFRKALVLDPASATAHNNLGTVLLRQGRAQDAVQFFGTSLAVDPTAVHAQNNLYVGARTLRSQHIFESSRKLLERISPAAYRYYMHRQSWVLKDVLMKYLLLCFTPIAGVLGAIALLEWSRNGSIEPSAYLMIGTMLNVFVLLIIALRWGYYRIGLLADEIPWLAPLLGALISPFALLIVGGIGLAYDEPRAPLYMFAMITGTVLAVILLARKLRGACYRRLSQWYPRFLQAKTSYQRRWHAFVSQRAVYPLWWTLRNPLSYVVLAAAIAYAQAGEPGMPLAIFVLIATVIIAMLKLWDQLREK